jgi:hypothetical protein
MTVVAVENCEVEAHFKPKPGHLKLGVQLVVEGRSTTEVPISPLVAKLVDAEGNEYSADLAGCTPTLPATRVMRGIQKKGFVTFEVPETAQGFVMSYAPFVLGMGVEELKFSLGR